jgi:hypothetical protein
MLQRRVSPYRLRRLTWTAVAAVLIALSIGVLAQERTLPTPNYELASRWMSAKVAKLVFDTSVAPHWAEQTDRFWYAYETAQGRKFYLVDPLKKGKTPLWDNAKMAAMLTGITRIPYDSQHLPITALTDAGFKFPEPFKVKADDGITDLFGVIYKPFDFDPARRYPVIAYVYPGPQVDSVDVIELTREKEQVGNKRPPAAITGRGGRGGQ